MPAPRRMILAAKAASLNDRFGDGFHRMEAAEVEAALREAGIWAGPRDDLEEDPAFRQVIPYLLAHDDGRFLSYRRPAKGGEARLHGLASIGVGGHVDMPDAVVDGGGVDIMATLARCVDRERDEEMGEHVATSDVRWVGLLLASDPIVHRVHVGIVCVQCVEADEVVEGDRSLEGAAFLGLDELAALAPEMELWSAMLTPHLRDLLG